MSKLISQLLVLMLIAIAGCVAIGLSKGANMWPVIILYWVVLTTKNVVDFIGGMR